MAVRRGRWPGRGARFAGCVWAAAALWASTAQAASLTFCSEGAPEGFDIAQYETIVTNDAAGIPLYDQLLAFKRGGTELAPGLAERWEVSADGLQVTLHLRAGVAFHTTAWFKPTRTMNADDVLWSVQRLNDRKHPAHAIAANGYAYWTSMQMPALLKAVDKLDAMTVRFTLTRPEAPFLANLALSSIGSVYSAEYAAQLAKSGHLEQLNTLPIGTGPFAFKSYQKDAVIRYVAHAGYWAGAPKIDTLIFAVTPDAAVRAQRVKAGECAVSHVLPEAAPSLAASPTMQVLRNTPLMTSYVALNVKKRFLGDVRFRRAMALAIDKPAFVRSVYSGEATPSASFLPPAMWGVDATMTSKHDIAEARRLVAASGYDGSTLTLYGQGRRSDLQRAAELLQSDWARIGVKVQLQMLEVGELYHRTNRGDHDLAFLSWYSDNGDPDNFFTPNLSCGAVGSSNKPQWCNQRFDALIDEARRSNDHTRRVALYGQAQRLVADEVPLIPMASLTELLAVQRKVEGVESTPFGGHDFRAARVK